MQEDVCKKMESSTEDGSIDVHSCGSFHLSVRLCCVVAGAGQEVEKNEA